MRLSAMLPFCVVLLIGCGDDVTGSTSDEFAAVRHALTIDPTAPPNYRSQALPGFYAPPVLMREDRTPANNATTNEGALLGRVLFFDVNLSRTRNIACASCHAQTLAFGDTAQFSLGIDGLSRTGAHSMRLGNARFNESGQYFWNRRAASLEAQATQPIQDAVEMGFDATHGGFAAVIARLDTLPYYAPLFKLAFGSVEISEVRVQRALAQYVRSILAINSRWDLAFAAVPPPPPGAGPNFLAPLPGFTAEETRGQELFFRPKNAGGAGCQGCHVAPSFSIAANAQTNGLDAGQTTLFRSPSLKNVGRSTRFMHDGRFRTLAEVVAFYDSGVQDGPALDNRLRGPDGGPQRLNLSAADRAALVAFLLTLNDQTLGADSRFSNPFRP